VTVTGEAVSRSPGITRARLRLGRIRALLVCSEDGALEARRAPPDRRVEVVSRLVMPADRKALAAAVSRHRPELVLVDVPLPALDFDLLHFCSARSIRVLVPFHPLYGPVSGRRIVGVGGVPWLPLRPLPIGPSNLLAKRVLDLALILLAAPLLVPLMALIALAIALESPGGVFYRQTRLGQGGRHFVLLKFRTMRVDAESESGPTLAAPADPRATALGRVLRRLRLDELPQLWNVVRGEMSLVGPRPERPELAGMFSHEPGFGHRCLLKPGLTGLAQLVGGYTAGPKDKLQCDLLYLTSRSIPLDLRLLWRTLLALLRGFPNG
jgi:lipopolysaccharide/colanic/teichoic acid biosynthesis glycosyltransferase